MSLSALQNVSNSGYYVLYHFQKRKTHLFVTCGIVDTVHKKLTNMVAVFPFLMLTELVVACVMFSLIRA